MGAKRKQNENLKKKSSYQDTLDSEFNFDKYVTATDTDYEDQQTLLMWKLILQKGYFSVNIQNDYVKHKSEIENIKFQTIKNYQEDNSKVQDKDRVETVFDNFTFDKECNQFTCNKT